MSTQFLRELDALGFSSSNCVTIMQLVAAGEGNKKDKH
jgi:hypothetical protein